MSVGKHSNIVADHTPEHINQAMAVIKLMAEYSFTLIAVITHKNQI